MSDTCLCRLAEDGTFTQQCLHHEKLEAKLKTANERIVEQDRLIRDLKRSIGERNSAESC